MAPNIGKPIRIAYVGIGVVLLASPLLATMEPWMRIAALILGPLAILGGATGL